MPDFELLDSQSTHHHLPISKKIHQETFFLSHCMFLPLVPSRPSHGSRGTRRCSTRWPRRTSTLSSIGSSKGETVTLHGATRRTGSPSSRRPRSPKRSTTMLNHTWIKGRFTVALKTKLNSKKKYFRCFQVAAAAAVQLFSLWLITIHSDSNKIYNRISMPQNYFSPSDNLVR